MCITKVGRLSCAFFREPQQITGRGFDVGRFFRIETCPSGNEQRFYLLEFWR